MVVCVLLLTSLRFRLITSFATSCVYAMLSLCRVADDSSNPGVAISSSRTRKGTFHQQSARDEMMRMVTVGTDTEKD